MHFLLLAGLLVLLAEFIDGCKITLKVESLTTTPFKLQILIPSINVETETILFERPSRKKVMITGENCMAKHWKFVTYKKDDSENWVVAKEGTAKLDGMGDITLDIGNELVPKLGARLGIACSESVICG